MKPRRRFVWKLRSTRPTKSSHAPRSHLRRLGTERLEDRRLLSIQLWPVGWESMEIEAKWSATESVLETIRGDFSADDPDRAFTIADTTEHYRIEVRWNGAPAKFSDYYYDESLKQLSVSKNALRHRQRDEWDATGIAPDFGDDLSALLAYPNWEESWQKVQFTVTKRNLKLLKLSRIIALSIKGARTFKRPLWNRCIRRR